MSRSEGRRVQQERMHATSPETLTSLGSQTESGAANAGPSNKTTGLAEGLLSMARKIKDKRKEAQEADPVTEMQRRLQQSHTDKRKERVKQRLKGHEEKGEACLCEEGARAGMGTAACSLLSPLLSSLTILPVFDAGSETRTEASSDKPRRKSRFFGIFSHDVAPSPRDGEPSATSDPAGTARGRGKEAEKRGEAEEEGGKGSGEKGRGHEGVAGARPSREGCLKAESALGTKGSGGAGGRKKGVRIAEEAWAAEDGDLKGGALRDGQGEREGGGVASGGAFGKLMTDVRRSMASRGGTRGETEDGRPGGGLAVLVRWRLLSSVPSLSSFPLLLLLPLVLRGKHAPASLPPLATVSDPPADPNQVQLRPQGHGSEESDHQGRGEECNPENE